MEVKISILHCCVHDRADINFIIYYVQIPALRHCSRADKVCGARDVEEEFGTLEARREGEGQDVADGDVEPGQGADQDPCQYSQGVNIKELKPNAKERPIILLICSSNLICNYGNHSVITLNVKPYLIFFIFLHRQNFWRIKFTPENA